MSKKMFGLLDVTLLLAGAIAFSGLIATQASSQPTDGTDAPAATHHGPPPEAIAACSNVAAGAACSFTGRHGDTVTGTCGAPEGKALACHPAHGRNGHAGAPPEDGGHP